MGRFFFFLFLMRDLIEKFLQHFLQPRGSTYDILDRCVFRYNSFQKQKCYRDTQSAGDHSHVVERRRFSSRIIIFYTHWISRNSFCARVKIIAITFRKQFKAFSVSYSDERVVKRKINSRLRQFVGLASRARIFFKLRPLNDCWKSAFFFIFFQFSKNTFAWKRVKRCRENPENNSELAIRRGVKYSIHEYIRWKEVFFFLSHFWKSIQCHTHRSDRSRIKSIGTWFKTRNSVMRKMFRFFSCLDVALQ